MRRLVIGITMLLGFAIARADEEKVGIDQVPKPVMTAVKARFEDARVTEAAKETEHEKVVYKVTIKQKEQKIDVTLTPEGQILMIERTIASKDLPAKTAKVLQEKYPKSTYKIVEEIIEVKAEKETLTFHEVLLESADKKLYEVKVSVNGKIAEVEEKKGLDQNDE